MRIKRNFIRRYCSLAKWHKESNMKSVINVLSRCSLSWPNQDILGQGTRPRLYGDFPNSRRASVYAEIVSLRDGLILRYTSKNYIDCPLRDARMFCNPLSLCIMCLESHYQIKSFEENI